MVANAEYTAPEGASAEQPVYGNDAATLDGADGSSAVAAKTEPGAVAALDPAPDPAPAEQPVYGNDAAEAALPGPASESGKSELAVGDRCKIMGFSCEGTVR